MNEKPILLIDHECTLCSSLVAFIERKGAGDKFRILSLYKEDGKQVLVENGLSADYDDSVVLIDEANVYLHSEAAIRLAAKLGGAWRFLIWLKVVPRPMRDWVYRMIAKHRHKIL